MKCSNMHWLTQSGPTESVEAMPMTLFVMGLARSLALADRAQRCEFGVCMYSWSPPQAALRIASLTEDCTNAPNFPKQIHTIIMIVMYAGRLAHTKCIGVSTTSTTLICFSPPCGNSNHTFSACRRPGVSEFVGSIANTIVSKVNFNARLQLRPLDTSLHN